MKRILLLAFAGTLVLASCSDSKKKDEEKKESDTKDMVKTENSTTNEAWIPVDSVMMDKAWKENMNVGEQHKMIAKLDGTWSGETKMWMGEGSTPMTSSTTTVNKMIYNGHYQESVSTGNMMGAPFEGKSTMGYDNLKKEFFSTWIDNMGSGMYYMTGQWDDASKKLTMTGTTICMNGKEMPMKEVLTIVDDNNHTLEMFGPDPMTGKEYRNMEIKYTRKK